MLSLYSDALYNLTASKLHIQHQLSWEVDSTEKARCHSYGKLEEECHNYVRLMASLNAHSDRFLLCGTNAYSPKCREYR